MDLETQSQEYSSQESSIENKTNLTQDLFALNVDLLEQNTQQNSQNSEDSQPLIKKTKLDKENNTYENGEVNSRVINNIQKSEDNVIHINTNKHTLVKNENCNDEYTPIQNNKCQSENESDSLKNNNVELSIELIKQNDSLTSFQTNSQEDVIMQSQQPVEQNNSDNDDKVQIQIEHEGAMCTDEQILKLDFDKKILDNNKLMELSRISWTSDSTAQHYTRGIIWSPDGTCALTAVNADGMQIFELPNDLYTIEYMESDRPVNTLKPAVHVKEGGTVYDYAWYPYMNSSMPESCCWIASRQHEPIMMWDAFTSELRCTYRGYDPFDEVESAISVQFSVDGQLVFGGYKKSIKIFKTNIPGRDYTEIKTKNAISCIAVSEAHPDTLICGSWKSNIYAYDMRSPYLGSVAKLKSHQGGITYIKYSKDGQKLYSGARKDGKIYEWDMRNYVLPVNQFDRNVSTNQRIYFDLSPSGDLIGSGDTNGIINIWDIKNKSHQSVFSLHQDCINGFNFHPTLPIIGTSCGQFHFDDNEIEGNNVEKCIEYENALIFWWYGDMKIENEVE